MLKLKAYFNSELPLQQMLPQSISLYRAEKLRTLCSPSTDDISLL